MQINRPNIRVARLACQEVQLPGIGGDNRIALQTPVGRRGRTIESQSFVRRGRRLIGVEVECGPSRGGGGDSAVYDEVTCRVLRTKNGNAVYSPRSKCVSFFFPFLLYRMLTLVLKIEMIDWVLVRAYLSTRSTRSRRRRGGGDCRRCRRGC